MTWLVVADGLSVSERSLLDKTMEVAGWPGGEVTVMLVPPVTTAKARKEARPAVLAELARVRPSRILAVGGPAASLLLGEAIPITRYRGMMEWVDYEGGSAVLVCTIHPGSVLKRAGAADFSQVGFKSSVYTTAGGREWYRDLFHDVHKWINQGEPLPVPEPAYIGPTTLKGLADGLDLFADYDVVSCDIETEPEAEALADLRANGAKGWRKRFPDAGLRPWVDSIMSLGIGTVTGPNLIVRRPLLDDRAARGALAGFLFRSGRTVVYHNGKFDLQFIARDAGVNLRWEALQFADTMLMSFLLDERPVRSMYRTHGLKDISRTRYDVPDYAFDWPEFWAKSEEDRDYDLLDRYHAMDLVQTARLYWDEQDELDREPALRRVHDRILAPASIALAIAESRGIPVDREYLLDYRRRLDRNLDRRLRGMRAAIGNPDFNPGSGREVEDLVFNEDPGFGLTPIAAVGWYQNRAEFKVGGKAGEVVAKRNSRKELLEKLADEQANPRQARVLRAITAWRHDMKARQTYAQGLLDSSQFDGRVHTSFNLGGTTTGRLSSSEPNLQNIPKRGAMANAIRRAFRAGPGMALMEADYSQLELRVAALLSRDPGLVRVYTENRDIHREVSAIMFHKPAEDINYLERYLAKAVDFGALYGRSGAAIAAGAEMEYYEKKMGGTRWTGLEAQAFVDRFLNGFPRLRLWLDATARGGLQDKQVETLFGRVRRFPFVLKSDHGSIRRQSFNMPIQSVASDICLSAFIRMTAELPDWARPLVTIHDSVLLEVEEAHLPEAAALVRRMMEEVPPVVAAANEGLGVPFAVDIKAGPTWRDDDMKEVEG